MDSSLQPTPSSIEDNQDFLSQLLQVALKQKVEYLWDLPVELQEQIYSVLSVKDKLVLGLANKKLQKILEDDRFWRPHIAALAQDRSFDLLLKTKTGGLSDQPFSIPGNEHINLRKGLQRGIEEASSLGKGNTGYAKSLFFAFMGLDKAMYTSHNGIYRDPRKAKPVVTFLFEMAARTAQLWQTWIRQGSCPPDTFLDMVLPRYLGGCHDLSILREGLYTMVYFIANSIALGLLSGEGSSNLWQTAQTWWHRFFQFLLQLEEQPMRRHSQLHGDFFSKGVQEWIAENEYGINTAFKWPSLTEIGKLAFRSQVLLRYGLRHQFTQIVEEASSMKLSRSGELSESERKREYLKTFLVRDHPKKKPQLHTRKTFKRLFELTEWRKK